MVQLVGRVEVKSGEHPVDSFILVIQTVKSDIPGEPASEANPVGFDNHVYKNPLNFEEIDPSGILSLHLVVPQVIIVIPVLGRFYHKLWMKLFVERNRVG